ncbi:MAG TPA: hypothetical protein VHI10_00650 [Mycobacterium sp.]|nr:hypothetical protein [Mycobacterium sp.]
MRLRLLGVGALAVFVVLAVLDLRLQDRGSGIIPFEIAFSESRAQEILAEWGDSGRDTALASLWIDYLFIAFYGTYLALLMPGRLAALPVAGAACDALENLFLLLTVGGRALDFAPVLAGVFAVGKFALLIATFGYLLARRFRR